MKSKHRFRPSASWILEDRVALTVSSPTAIVAAAIPHGMTAMFHGGLTTFIPTAPGGTETAHLNGSSVVHGVGPVRVAGNLHVNASEAPPFSNTGGTLTFISRRHPGVLTISLDGPPTNLAPSHKTTTQLTFRVVNASGQFAPLSGATGIANLTLQIGHHRGGNIPPNIARGAFGLRLITS